MSRIASSENRGLRRRTNGTDTLPYKVMGLEEKLHKQFSLLNHQIKSNTTTVVLIPDYQPYSWWDTFVSGIGFISEGFYAAFSSYSTTTYQEALITKFNIFSPRASNIFKGFSVSSAIVDAIISWLMMANTPAEVQGAKEAFARIKKDLKEKDWGYFCLTIFYDITLLITYVIGALAPITGIVLSNWITKDNLGSFSFLYGPLIASLFATTWFGQLFIYIYTNVEALTSLPEQIYQHNNKDWTLFKGLTNKMKALLILLTLFNVAFRGIGFFGGVQMFKQVLDIWGLPTSDSFFNVLGVIAGICAGINTYAGQSSRNLKILSGKHPSSYQFVFKNSFRKYLFSSLFWICMLFVGYSRASSGPEKVVFHQLDQYTQFDLRFGIFGLLGGLISAIQYDYWAYPGALKGLHYLMHETDCYRDTVFTEVGGYDGKEYIKLTEAEMKKLKDAAEKEGEEEEEEEKQSNSSGAPKAENQGVFGFLRDWLYCRQKPDNASINTDSEAPLSHPSDEKKRGILEEEAGGSSYITTPEPQNGTKVPAKSSSLGSSGWGCGLFGSSESDTGVSYKELGTEEEKGCFSRIYNCCFGG